MTIRGIRIKGYVLLEIKCWQLSVVNRIWHYMSKSKEWVNFANFCVLPYLFICRCSLNYWGLLFAYFFSTYAETFNAKMPCALCPIRISGKTATQPSTEEFFQSPPNYLVTAPPVTCYQTKGVKLNQLLTKDGGAGSNSMQLGSFFKFKRW